MNPTLRTLVLFLLFSQSLKSQMSGTYSVPGSYVSLAAAITDLNTQGVNGPVTILISAGFVETAPVGGYVLLATGTAANPITFQKSGTGADPQITAYSGGYATPASAVQDGIWKFYGCDYVTVDGISLLDQNVNNPSTMEFGFGYFKSSVTNGCHQNTIKNCVITLKRINNVNGSGPASEGSRGIDVVNALPSFHTTPLTITNASGSNSFNHFYNNLIQNCNIGVAIIGFAATSPFVLADYDNDIGGISSITSNTIINFGGGTASQAAYGIKTSAQYNLNASNNSINSNTGSGLPHPAALYGIYSGAAISADVTISSNTVTLKGSGTTSMHYGILNLAGATPSNNFITMESNLITNCSYTTATTGVFQGVVNALADAATVTLNYNSVTNNTCSSISNGYFCIVNEGAAANVNINGNQAFNIYFTNTSGTPSFMFINNIAGAFGGTLTINSNSVSAINITPAVGNSFYGINISGNITPARTNILNNFFGNINIASNGPVYLIFQNNNAVNTLVSGNITSGSITKTGSNFPVYCYYRAGNSSIGGATITSNYFSNVATNNNGFFGIYNANSSLQTNSILSNTISNISAANGQITGIWHGLANKSAIKGNLVSTLTGSGAITGIQLNGVVSDTLNVFNNTLTAFTSGGSFSVSGYYQASNSNVNFYGNKISDLSGINAGSQVFGVRINSGLTTNIVNNIIGNLYAPNGNNLNAVNGIYVNGGSSVNIFYNTVRLNVSSTGANFGSSALYASVNPTVNIRNTILINLSSQNGTGQTVAYRRSGTGLSGYSAVSDNNLFYAGTPSASNLIFSDATNMLQSINAFKSFLSPWEALSVTENTSFLSTIGASSNFLHVDPLATSLAESHAVNIPGYSTDFDSEIRQGNLSYTATGLAPDIGADEFESIYPNCTTVNTPTISAVAGSICAGQAPVINANPEAPYPGVFRQWLAGTNSAGPYSPISGANGISYTGAGLTAGVYYYIFVNTCTITSVTYTSNAISVFVSAYPSVTVSPATATLCAGSSPILLTASGATSYSWLPLNGLNTGSLAAVSASPATTTTYVVTGINPGNCTNTVSATVYRQPSAGGITVTPSSTIVCQGYDVDFQAISTNTTYAVSPITFSPITTQTNVITTLCNNGLVVTWPQVGGLDDGGWQNLPIPFTFRFFEVGYTSFCIGTNGFITLGAGLPNTLHGYGLVLPNPNAAAPCVGAVYSDLEFSYTGTINTFTTGTTPNRRLVVNWVNGRYYTSNVGVGNVTTQVILYETTNNIEVHTTISTGQDASVEGIQNSNGTNAFAVPGRNTSFFSITNDAYRWSFVKNVNWQLSTYLTSTSSFTPTAQNLQGNIVYTISATTGNGCTVSTTSSLSVIPSPTIIVSSIFAPVCAGTPVTLAASGANTFTWNTGVQNATLNVSPVITATHTASGTGTLNTCIGYASAIVTVMPNPNLIISGSPSLCAGFTQTYSVSGADTYTWSTGSSIPTFTFAAITNSVYSVAGTNTLTSCGASKQLSISVYPNPTVSVSGPTLICAGQSAILNGSGANTYAWSNGPTTPNIFPTPLVTTMYSVTGFSGPPNCSDTAVFTVSVNPTPIISVSSPTQICEGGSLILSASGAVTYTWSNGASTSSVIVNPVSTTNYNVSGTGTLNSCAGFAVTTVTVNPIPTLSIEVVSSATICEGESVQLTGTANGADSFFWSNAAATSSISVAPAITSVYSLNVSNSTTGCMTDAYVEIVVNICTGIRTYTEDEISVYPNPAENKLFVKNISGIRITYELGDINGRILLSGNLGENKNSILIEGLAKGIYYLRIKGDRSQVLKIVKL